MKKRTEFAQSPAARPVLEGERHAAKAHTSDAALRKPYAAPSVVKRRSVKHATLVTGNQSQGVGSSGNF